MSEIPEDIIEAAREAAAITWGQDGCVELAREFRSGMRDDSGSVQTAVAALVADRQRDRWQPIETIPLGQYVLIYRGEMGVNVFSAEDEDWRDAFEFDTHEPTHWQPLPAAPKGE